MRIIQHLRPAIVPPPRTSLAALLLGCAPGCGPASGDLALGEDWALVDPADDPIAGAPTEASPCSSLATAVEAGAIELDTNACPWVTVRAPSRERIRAGDEIELFLFHTALTAPDPAQATIQINLEEDVLWTRTIDIPAATNFFETTVEAPTALRAGEYLYFHAHNHGSNTYTLGHLRLP